MGSGSSLISWAELDVISEDTEPEGKRFADAHVKSGRYIIMVASSSQLLGARKNNYIYIVLYLYLFSLFLFEPYGVVVGSFNLRIPDVVSIVLLMLSFGRLLTMGRMVRCRSIILFFLFIFVIAEISLPVFGVLYFSDISAISSSFRAIVYWMPLACFFLIHDLSYNAILNITEHLLKLTLIINFSVVLMQLLVFYYILPAGFNIKQYLLDYTIYQSRYVNFTSMASGLFVNTTSLAIFSLLSFIFFWTRYIASNIKRHFHWATISFCLLLLAVSRAPTAAAFLIIVSSIPILGFRRGVSKLPLMIVIIGVIFSILVFLGYDVAHSFHRFSRLGQGFSTDYSLMHRINILWPTALENAREYFWGTLTNPTKYLGTIDSGYLTYYIQGRWFLLTTLVLFLLSIFASSIKLFFHQKRTFGLLAVLFLAIYISGGLIVSNPMHDARVTYFILFYLFSSNKKFLIIS